MITTVLPAGAQTCTAQGCKITDRPHEPYENKLQDYKSAALMWPDGAQDASDADDVVGFAGLSWSTSINHGLLRARQLNKPLFVFAEAKDCGYCQKFRNEILPQQTVTDYLTNNFVRARIFVGSADGKILQSRFKMDGWPTFLIFKQNGALVAQWGGCPDDLTGRSFVRKAKQYMETVTPHPAESASFPTPMTVGSVRRPTVERQVDFHRLWVFSSGVHKFDNDYLHPGCDAVVGEDLDMMTEFRRRGVPEDHIVFLRDDEATKSRCQAGLQQLISKAKPGDALFFFAHSHGGNGVICTYKEHQGWYYDDLIDQIERDFGGSQAFVFIAACHSGSFVDVLRKSQRRVAYFALTSAHPDRNAFTIATADFEACIADGVSGSPCPDLNRDGLITFEELARYTSHDQFTLFSSKPYYGWTDNFDENMVFSQSRKSSGGLQCDLCRTDSGYSGRILEQDSSRGVLLRPRKFPRSTIWVPKDQVNLLDD